MTSRVMGDESSGAEGAEGAESTSGVPSGGSVRAGSAGSSGAEAGLGGATGSASGSGDATGTEAEGRTDSGASTGEVGAGRSGSRRPPALTTDTARPEGSGRAAAGGASAPARQWPLLTVVGLAALGLLIVGTDLIPQSFRVGTILVGVALLVGAGLRRLLPSVGMLAVRSRFTDMVTYGVMGGLIVLLALMVQPAPWLKIPFLEDILHLTIT
ncbi:DUF3017 domain-containing protein [Streptomyces sp. P9(2023)]|uniref:DUF3017 domain-containing protein n=1 Tax=Streptomyces sp. P9(2023) TaxID=3064394 RepID=UPI0028F42137|nr:DUF3017 domain-containing protein [Streptomyces sp. P9(2023)]MDT9688737.1 DUF3017 domain-containing protein [Streptomyces sp. P9(2023)]